MRKGQFHEAAVMGGKHNVGHTGGLRSQAHPAAKSDLALWPLGQFTYFPPTSASSLPFGRLLFFPHNFCMKISKSAHKICVFECVAPSRCFCVSLVTCAVP